MDALRVYAPEPEVHHCSECRTSDQPGLKCQCFTAQGDYLTIVSIVIPSGLIAADDQVCPETQTTVFHDDFFRAQDVVINALVRA